MNSKRVTPGTPHLSHRHVSHPTTSQGFAAQPVTHIDVRSPIAFLRAATISFYFGCVRLRARPEVGGHRRHVLAIDDPVAVDILRAAVARAQVAEHLADILPIDDAVTVHVPHAR